MTPQNHIPPDSFHREHPGSAWKMSKYTLLAYVYFFFNALALPKGLLYTTVLSPWFFYRQLVNKRETFWRPFVYVLVFFDVVHLCYGVNVTAFLKSNVYFTFTYFTVISFYHFVNNYHQLSKLFRQLLVLNFIFALIAIPFFFMSPDYQDWFWWVNREAMAKHEFPRLKLLTYEASYYSLLMVPVVYYYVFKYLFRQITQYKHLIISMTLLPVIMSMSFGVIGATALTAVILGFSFRKKLLRYKRPFFITVGFFALIVMTLLVLLLFFPESAVSLRLTSVFRGTDTSANGRTSDSFGIAWGLISKHNIWFGIGLGQVKIQIENMVREFYSYWGYYARYDIPNAMAETLAIFGILGVALRLGLEWYLFFKTKVKTNYYRLALFIFVFIYQFTGSFITNIVEYTIWILAFSNVFEQFNVNEKQL